MRLTLALYLYIPQLCKIEVPLLLQGFYQHLQILNVVG